MFKPKAILSGVIFILFSLLAVVDTPELIYGTQTGKFIFFSYCILLITFLCVTKLMLNGGSSAITIAIDVLDILLLLLTLYIVVNRYFIQPIYGFSMKSYELVGLCILYIVLRNASTKVFPYLLLAVVISGILEAVYGNLQLWGHYPSSHLGFKMTGNFFNPGPYAGFLAAVFPVALGTYLFRDRISVPIPQQVRDDSFKAAGGELQTYYHDLQLSTRNSQRTILNLKRLLFKYLPLIGIITTLLVIPASRSRAAWLGVLVSGLYLVALKYDVKVRFLRFVNTTAKRFSVVVVVLILVVGSSAGLYFFKKGSADGRLLIWKVTANLIQDHPIFGTGFDRFNSRYMNYQADYFMEYPDSKFIMTAGDVRYAFNEPLQFVAEQGIAGLVIMLILIFYLIQKADTSDPLQLISWGGLISITTFSLFSYPSEILPIKMIFIMMLAMIVTQSKKADFFFRFDLFRQKGSALSYPIKAIVAGCVLTAVVVAWRQINQLNHAYKDWREAIAMYQMGIMKAAWKGMKVGMHFLPKTENFCSTMAKRF